MDITERYDLTIGQKGKVLEDLKWVKPINDFLAEKDYEPLERVMIGGNTFWTRLINKKDAIEALELLRSFGIVVDFNLD